MIYLASSWRNQRQPVVLAALRGAGHEVYDFRNPGNGKRGFAWREIDPNWMEWDAERFRDALQSPVAAQGFANDMSALQHADICVLLLPCGRSAHLEAGWAAGAGKRVLVLLEEQNEPELMYRMFDKLCVNLDELITELGDSGKVGWGCGE